MILLICLNHSYKKGNIKVVASTTWEEYRKYFEKDPALMRRFARVTIDEPSKEITRQILMGIKKYYEQFPVLTSTEEVVDASTQIKCPISNRQKIVLIKQLT